MSETLFHSERRSERRHLQLAVIASVLLHAFAALALARGPEKSPERRIEVTLLPSPAPDPKPVAVPPVREQLVTPSETESPPPEIARFRSEKSSRAEKETLRRGDPLVKPGKVAPKEPPPKPAGEPPAEAKLRLSEAQLNKALGSGPKAGLSKPTSDKPSDSVRREKFQSAEPFQHSITASLFRENAGAADYLPQIPDGDITLLNAKADRYAVFVRRVALQVFGALRKLNWAELTHSELRRMRGFVQVEAVMDKSGKLVKVILRDSSGSSNFDQIAQKAASEGSWDQNPPADAAAQDGMIHFIFEARSWSRASQGGIGEQRWLLLGTGLL